MVPRTEIVSISLDSSMEEVLAIIKNEKYTRYPVINGDKDNIEGVVNIKEILTASIASPSINKESSSFPLSNQ